MAFKRTKIWVSRIIEARWPIEIPNPFWAGMCRLGLPVDGAFALFYSLRHKSIHPSLLFGIIFGLIWLNVGPGLIWYYHERLLPQFFTSTRDLRIDAARLAYLSDKYDRMFARGFWVVSVPWMLFLNSVYWEVSDSLIASEILLGQDDPCYWLGFVAASWIALFTSIGFWGVVVTIAAIREVSHETIAIDPLHPDNLGGLSCVGRYAIGTTVLFSTGTLFLPLAFELLSETSRIAPYFYAGVVLLSGFILLTFVYPTVMICKKAESVRGQVLAELGEKCVALRNEWDQAASDGVRDTSSCLRLLICRQEYLDYRSVRLYPFRLQFVAQLFLSVVFPLVLLFFELQWGR